MDNFKEYEINIRLKKFIEYLNITAYEFSKKIGSKRPDGIYKILKNEVKPSPKTLNKIKNSFPELNYTWLLTGKDEMLSSLINLDLLELIDKEGVQFKNVQDLALFITKNHQSLLTDKLYKNFILGIEKDGIIKYYEDLSKRTK